MTDLIRKPTHRRSFLAGSLVSLAALGLPACATYGAGGGFSMTEVIRRLMLLSSERAFARLTSQGGFWDQTVSQVGLNEFLGTRGDVLSRVLTSALFKSRLEDVVADVAVDASYRAAPIVADTVRIIGPANAIDLIRGGPSAATSFLRQEMGMRLVEAMIPQIGDALRIADDPLMGQLLSAATGVDVGGVARSFAGRVDDYVWQEMAREEAAIRADPASTRDPMLMGVLGAESAF